jgi:hypothetical protein
VSEGQIPPHLEEVLRRSRAGLRERVLAALGPGEQVQYASEGELEEASAAPGGGGRRQAGLLLLTDRRILLIRAPGRLRSNPRPVSIPYAAVENAGAHKSDPRVIVVLHDADPAAAGHYLILPETGDQGMAARIWGTTIIQAAEASRR